MDLLNTIKAKYNSIKSEHHSTGLESVIIHIEIAEKYFERARNESDEHLYTDVIYRTNHAFEGILKEAYTIFEGKKDTKKSSFEIEKYLIDKSLLKEKVFDLFTNYRSNWRNPSTHDYKLFFSEQEALLAIVTVSAFVMILLDQIIEKIAYQISFSLIQNKKEIIKNNIANYKSLNFIDKIVKLLWEFAKEIKFESNDIKKISEAEYLGMISGFIKSVEPSYNISTDVKLPISDSILWPDLMIKNKDETIIIELKKAPRSIEIPKEITIDEAHLEQLKNYLIEGNVSNGILYYFPQSNDALMSMTIHNITINNKEYSIYEIRPYVLTEKAGHGEE